eukprot:TRINITY_DN102367_c0_g1_i1.p1 TRINITY_DN102367_c0_g1~~TRINITY_DN102367_c0_g1_i1.p1  ORF type:complete len:354 (+),score=113.57 TRINITY_DN102367_c0_g1_i1:113-1174(+)
MGRHGGINILHQKSWHVWRMDNRLRVERDELQHAAEEKDIQRRQHQGAFEGKLAKLRRRSVGISDKDEARADTNEDKVPGGSQRAKGTLAIQTGKMPNSNGNGDDFGKYGVTVSNLKHAETHLDQCLKWKKDRPQPNEDAVQGRGYWGNEGLGSGPHINLFEGAELEVQKQAASHGKLMRYADINNELAGKSKKLPLSEFDAVACEKPWYLQSLATCSSSSSSGRQRNEESQPAELTRIWKENHGQTVLRVKIAKNATAKKEEVEKKEAQDEEEDEEESKVRKRRVKKEEKTQKKQRKEVRKQTEKAAKLIRRKEQKHREQEVLRQQRLHREQQERARSLEMMRRQGAEMWSR